MTQRSRRSMRGAWAIVLLCGLLHTGGCLECLECFGLPYSCQETVRECYLYQTVCISKAYTYEDANGTRDHMVKGCSQGVSCNKSAYVNMGSRAMYISSSCCYGNRCNKGTYYGGNQTESIVKGCGTGPLCGRRLDYNTGRTTVYSQVDCCSFRFCNTGAPTVIVDPKPNGLQCYACSNPKECVPGNITQISCTGQMSRCLDVVGFTGGNTLMRGCCSEKVCLGLFASLSVPANQKLYCCKGNLCNTGKISSYYSTSGGRSSWGTSAGWMLLFATAMGWAF